MAVLNLIADLMCMLPQMSKPSNGPTAELDCTTQLPKHATQCFTYGILQLSKPTSFIFILFIWCKSRINNVGSCDSASRTELSF